MERRVSLMERSSSRIEVDSVRNRAGIKFR